MAQEHHEPDNREHLNTRNCTVRRITHLEEASISTLE